MRIVGVVEDMVQSRAENGPQPAVYVPYTQFGWPIAQLVVRSELPADLIIPELRRAVSAGVSSMVPLQELGMMTDRMTATRATPRFQASLVGAFATVALLLAAAGLYGAMTHLVGRRQRELGVRMALGADRADVLRMVLAQGLWVCGGGLTIGILIALLTTRLLSELLYEVNPNDPISFLLGTAVFILVSALACLGPARRATAVDPAIVLQAE